MNILPGVQYVLRIFSPLPTSYIKKEFKLQTHYITYQLQQEGIQTSDTLDDSTTQPPFIFHSLRPMIKRK